MSTAPPMADNEIHKDTAKNGDDESERRYSHDALNGDDAEFGGHEERKRIEKKLLRKIDLRVSILIVIYMYDNILALTYTRSYSQPA